MLGSTAENPESLSIMKMMLRAFCLASALWAGLAGLALASPERVALVLGMSAYQSIEPLTNTRNDAEALDD